MIGLKDKKASCIRPLLLYTLHKKTIINTLQKIPKINKIFLVTQIRKNDLSYVAAKSIYEEEPMLKKKNQEKEAKTEETISPFFFQSGNKYVSEKIRKTIFMNTMEEIKLYFENSLNELKYYEYVYFLFKIYELLFLNFYNCYKDSTVFKLNNPNFAFVSFSQYVKNHLKKEVRNANVPLAQRNKEAKENLKNIKDTKNENEINDMNEIHCAIVTKLYFQYVSNLDFIYIKKEQWKQYTNAFLTKQYFDLYNKTLQIIYKKIAYFSCFDIINFLYIVKKIHTSSIKDVYLLAQYYILKNLKYVEEEDLVKIGYVFLNNSNKKKNILSISKKCSKEFMESYLHLILHKIKNMNNHNFIKILEYVSNNNYKHVYFYRECKGEIYRRMNFFSLEQKIQLFYLYAQNPSASDKLLMSMFIKEIAQDITINESNTSKNRIKEAKNESVGQHNVSFFIWLNGIWANAKYFKEYPILLKGCESLISKNIMYFNAASVSMLIWAYSAVEIKVDKITFDPTIYVKLKKRALQVYKKMTPKQLSNALLGLAVTLGRTITGEGIADTDFHREIEQYLLETQITSVKKDSSKEIKEKEQNERNSKKKENILTFFTAEDIANTCYSYCIVRSGGKELHALLQNTLINKTSDLSPQQIAKIVFTYGTLYMYSSYTLLSLLQYEILQRMHQFSYSEICDILWAYCVNRYYDPNYWKALLYIIDFEKVYNDEKCSLLYSCLSFINLINSSIMDSYDVLRIFKLLKEQYWNLQTAEFPHNFANEVIEIMEGEKHLSLLEMDKKGKEGNIEAETKKSPYHHFECVKKLYDFEGFLIDIYFEYKNVKYAIFLHTSLNTTVDGKPLGESILKSRFIKKKNFKQIHLLYSIWKKEEKKKMDLIYSQL